MLLLVGLELAEVIFCESCLCGGVERRLNDIFNLPNHHPYSSEHKAFLNDTRKVVFTKLPDDT